MLLYLLQQLKHHKKRFVECLTCFFFLIVYNKKKFIFISQKEAHARKEDRNKRSSNDMVSPPTPEEASAAYESDFESEIPSEKTPSASEISERLTDEAKDASLVSEAQYSSYKSQVEDSDDDRTLSRSSVSVSRHSDPSSRSSSSNATVTHGPSPDRHVKEVAVQTQMDGFAYTWSSGRFL